MHADLMRKLLLFLMLAVFGCSLPGAAAADTPHDATAPSDDTPRYEKRHDTALLLVAFGSTYPEPHATYARQLAQFREAFPEADIFLSFTSGVCIRRWEARSGERYFMPDVWLASFAAKGYRRVCVQSLHIFPGEEFQLLRDRYIGADAAPAVCCGTALLTSDADIEAVGRVLADTFAAELQAGEAVAFMGHGNARAAYAEANGAYARIERAMQTYAAARYGNGRIFVGTVDYEPMLIGHVIEQLEAAGVPKKTPVNLHPLMAVAGDHANNDMSDEEDDESWISLLKAAGWTTVKPTVKGLGDYPAVNAIWIDHLREAMAGR